VASLTRIELRFAGIRRLSEGYWGQWLSSAGLHQAVALSYNIDTWKISQFPHVCKNRMQYFSA